MLQAGVQGGGTGRVGAGWERVLSCEAVLETPYHRGPLCPLQSAPTQMPSPSLSSLGCCVPPGTACSWTSSSRSTRRKQKTKVRPGLQRVGEPGREESSCMARATFSCVLNLFLASVRPSVHPSLHPLVAEGPSVPIIPDSTMDQTDRSSFSGRPQSRE